MCGRFAIDIEKPVFERRFHIRQLTIKLEPHYNVTPGMFLPTVIRLSPNRAVLMKWGLIPHWSREFRVKFSNINARAESIEHSPAYRVPFRRSRCLIPAIGFYEWALLSDGTKWPYFFKLKDRTEFAFAGIWDMWKDAEGVEFQTCAIITCPANSVVGKIHPRMPVVLREDDEELWLSDTEDTTTLKALLTPYSASDMTGHRVELRVNNPQNDDARLVDAYKERTE
jgi:putative SOS response-associated peptidase YedK